MKVAIIAIAGRARRLGKRNAINIVPVLSVFCAPQSVIDGMDWMV